MGATWTFPAAEGGLARAAGTAVTAIVLTAGTPVPPPILPRINIPGTKLFVEADLEITSTSATPTLTIGLYLGAVGGAIGSATLLVASAANAISASAAAWPIKLRYRGRFNDVGTAVTMHGTAELLYPTSLTAWASSPLPQTAAARTTAATINTEQNNQLDVGITLSSATGTPSVTVTGIHHLVSG
jgi:hypothetical protein